MDRFIKKSFLKSKKELGVSLICILFYTISMIAIPITVKIIVENFDKNENDVFSLIIAFFILVGVYICQTIINILWNLSLDKLGGRFIANISNDMIYRLTHSDYQEIEKIGLPKIKSILYSDVFDCFRLFGNFIPNIISSIIVVAFCVVYSFLIDINTTFIILIACLLGFFLTIISKKRLNLVGKQTNLAMKKIYANDVDVCDNINEIKINDLINYELDKNDEYINGFVKTAQKEDCVSFFWSGLVNGYNEIIGIFVSLFIAFYTNGSILQNVLFYTVLVSLILSHVEKIENSLHRSFKLKPSIDNVSMVYHLDVYAGKDSLSQIELIRLDNLGFGYSNTIFDGLNLEFKKGDVIKLEGINGSGKSTLIKLLLQVYHPHKGNILVNGIDYRNYELSNYLSKIVYVGQDEKLINLKVIDYHKKIFSSNFDEKKYKSICENLNLDCEKDIIDNGLNLSQGQRKKALLIKFLLCVDKDLIVLDEVFAGLDVETKKYLSDFINQLSKNKILIIVNHEDDEINYTRTIRLA